MKKGCKHSDKTKRKMSAIRKGFKVSKETKRKISLAKIGKKLPPFTEEHRKRLSMALKGKKKNYITKTAFKKGHLPWCTGMKGHFPYSGEKSPRWKKRILKHCVICKKKILWLVG